MAPLKSSTIPRLELCAALLLAKWMARIRITLSVKLKIVDVYAWSDSATVLNWLQYPHESFKIFVSNRVYKIQSLLPQCRWSYISSSSNPADCSSRGLLPSELIKHKLYFRGPAVLYLSNEEWDTAVPVIPADQLPEIKAIRPVVITTHVEESEWYTQFSSCVQLIRVTARIRRFIAKCRCQPAPVEYITRDEFDQAALAISRSSQLYYFHMLRQELSHNRPVSMRPVARLRPFIDEKNLIRVGGRLSRSDLPDHQKHPILLSKSSYFSLLVIRHWHEVTGYSEPQIISSLVCRTYWILSLRTLTRTVISRCTRCVRLTVANPQPVMADLPASRVTESRPFSRVGIDYAGPLLVKESRLRKARQSKIYVAVFVCFAVRAVHLELVSDLSTEAFMAALNRFVARRGLPSDIFSDCGTNFIGADNQLRTLVNEPAGRDQLTSGVQCNWHFNPRSAPHFGGL
ncbi:uncharacterized protein LOC112681080 [Sipha flava]|uniref:Uncharacterized protein LOC112681080 n=1 Tax=Sipha flava TaxID=143950 RepID=A0A8B8F8N4_9HEMI|nr:uncharacterized protein LOC112681080 [Sipha flava]